MLLYIGLLRLLLTMMHRYVVVLVKVLLLHMGHRLLGLWLGILVDLLGWMLVWSFDMLRLHSLGSLSHKLRLLLRMEMILRWRLWWKKLLLLLLLGSMRRLQMLLHKHRLLDPRWVSVHLWLRLRLHGSLFD